MFSQRPVGLMAVVMQAFYTLLKHIKEPLLPHMSVHKPVCQVNTICLCKLRDSIRVRVEGTKGRGNRDLQRCVIINVNWGRPGAADLRMWRNHQGHENEGHCATCSSLPLALPDASAHTHTHTHTHHRTHTPPHGNSQTLIK